MFDPYDEDVEGNRYMKLQVADDKNLKNAPVGTRVRVKVEGEVVEVEASRKVRDYSKDWDRKKGEKPPTKTIPGCVKLKLDKNNPSIGIQDLADMMNAEEID